MKMPFITTLLKSPWSLLNAYASTLAVTKLQRKCTKQRLLRALRLHKVLIKEEKSLHARIAALSVVGIPTFTPYLFVGSIFRPGYWIVSVMKYLYPSSCHWLLNNSYTQVANLIKSSSVLQSVEKRETLLYGNVNSAVREYQFFLQEHKSRLFRLEQRKLAEESYIEDLQLTLYSKWNLFIPKTTFLEAYYCPRNLSAACKLLVKCAEYCKTQKHYNNSYSNPPNYSTQLIRELSVTIAELYRLLSLVGHEEFRRCVHGVFFNQFGSQAYLEALYTCSNREPKFSAEFSRHESDRAGISTSQSNLEDNMQWCTYQQALQILKLNKATAILNQSSSYTEYVFTDLADVNGAKEADANVENLLKQSLTILGNSFLSAYEAAMAASYGSCRSGHDKRSENSIATNLELCDLLAVYRRIKIVDIPDVLALLQIKATKYKVKCFGDRLALPRNLLRLLPYFRASMDTETVLARECKASGNIQESECTGDSYCDDEIAATKEVSLNFLDFSKKSILLGHEYEDLKLNTSRKDEKTGKISSIPLDLSFEVVPTVKSILDLFGRMFNVAFVSSPSQSFTLKKRPKIRRVRAENSITQNNLRFSHSKSFDWGRSSKNGATADVTQTDEDDEKRKVSSICDEDFSGLPIALDVLEKRSKEMIGTIFLNIWANNEMESTQPFCTSIERNQVFVNLGISAPDSRFMMKSAAFDDLPECLKLIFHELGHAMHLIFSQQNICSEAPLRAETRDFEIYFNKNNRTFFEVPPVLMEYVALHPSTLRYLAQQNIINTGSRYDLSLDILDSFINQNSLSVYDSIFHWMPHYAIDLMLNSQEFNPDDPSAIWKIHEKTIDEFFKFSPAKRTLLFCPILYQVLPNLNRHTASPGMLSESLLAHLITISWLNSIAQREKAIETKEEVSHKGNPVKVCSKREQDKEKISSYLSIDFTRPGVMQDFRDNYMSLKA